MVGHLVGLVLGAAASAGALLIAADWLSCARGDSTGVGPVRTTLLAVGPTRDLEIASAKHARS
jgi:hypothetical protein